MSVNVNVELNEVPNVNCCVVSANEGTELTAIVSLKQATTGTSKVNVYATWLGSETMLSRMLT